MIKTKNKIIFTDSKDRLNKLVAKTEEVTRVLIFGIDYDDTFTAAPELFTQMISQITNAGHRAVLVTGRSSTGLMGSQVIYDMDRWSLTIPVVFAGPKWKVDAAKESGYNVDIWIDDMPQFINPAPTILNTETF